MRNRGPRDNKPIVRIALQFVLIWLADCRYAAEVTISRKNLFTSQPESRNSTASQSSSSGCDGGSPCDPKSSAVFTMPVPNTCCQNRFTVTRAIRGLEGSTIHSAKPSRLRGKDCDIGGKTAGHIRMNFVALGVVLPAK